MGKEKCGQYGQTFEDRQETKISDVQDLASIVQKHYLVNNKN